MKNLTFLSNQTKNETIHSGNRLETVSIMWPKIATVLCFLLTLSIGHAWGAEEVVYTLDGTTTGGSSGYDSESEITQSSLTWKVTGNTTMNPWRIGGKSLTDKDRTIYSTGTISNNVTKIEISHGAASSVTVNSMTIVVSKNANFSSPVSTLTPTFAANSTVTVNRPDGKDWTGCYYKIIYNITISSTSNKYIAFNFAKFYAETGGGGCTAPTITSQPSSASYTVGDTPTNLSVTATGASLTYQWYSNTSATNSGGTSISGATSSTYTPSTAAAGTFYYYCVVSSSTCDTPSNAVTITVTSGGGGGGNCATYTVTSTSTVSTTGTAPTSSSATYSQTYGTACQMTSGNSVTLTLSGYGNKKITGITVSVHSNTSGGRGSLSATAGSTTIASIADAAFNTAAWNGSWSTAYVDKVVPITNSSYVIGSSEDVIITINATANSLYCQSYTICWEDFSGTTYTVAYDKNNAGASGSMSSSTYPENATVTVPSNAFTAPSGYIFDHWNTAANNSGTSYSPGNTFTITGNVTLYAQWTTAPTCSYTEATSLNVGDEILIIDDTYRKVMTGATSGAVTSFTTCADETYRFIVEKGYNGSNFALKNNNNNLYLNWTSGGTTLSTASTVSSTNASWTVENVGGKLFLKNVSGDRYILLYNNDNMRAYASTTQANTTQPTIYLVSSCEGLGAITGSVTLSQSGTSLVISGWSATPGAHETGYSIKVYDNSSFSGSPVYTGSATVATKTCTISGVATGRYWVTVTPIYSGSDPYCSEGTVTQAGQINMAGDVTITFNKNGGGGTMSNQTILASNYGQSTKLNSNTFTAPSGKAFTGWNTAADGSGTSYADGAIITLYSNITLYAQWGTSYTITLHRKDATENITVLSTEFPYTLPTNEADYCDAWIFDGWSATSVANNSDSYTKVTQATTAESAHFYAVYRGAAGTEADAYVRIKKAEDLTSGGTYIFVGLGSGTRYVLPANSWSDDYNNFTGDVIPEDGPDFYLKTTINTNNSTKKYTWTITGSANNWVIKNTIDSKYINNSLATAWYTTSTSNYRYSITPIGLFWTVKNTYGSASKPFMEFYNTRFTNANSQYGSGALQIYKLGKAQLYKYTSTPSGGDCTVSCTASGAEFTYPSMEKSTASASFTNTVVYTENTNNSATTYSSSNTDVAIVTNAGIVSIVGKGKTTITMTQGRDNTDAAHPICGITISYELNVTDPSLEVVEVTADDKIIVEHDFDGITNASVDSSKTEIKGTIADDIFISKYYEAASHMKLFALYNGTEHNIDLSQLRVRSGSSTWGDHGHVTLSKVKKLGEDYPGYQLPPFTEIIFWSNYEDGENNAELQSCVNMNINGKNYDYSDMIAGNVPGWYLVGSLTASDGVDADGNKSFFFNGDDALILERSSDNFTTWTVIDLFGAGTKDEPAMPKGSGNGQIRVESSSSTTSSDLNDEPGGYYWDATSAAGKILSTNRFYLTRLSTVKSGSTAVGSNAEAFVTLGSEWTGKGIGGGKAMTDMCGSGELFSEVAQYDYAGYYTDYVAYATGWTATDNNDGTFTIQFNDGYLAKLACKKIKISVEDEHDNTKKAEVEYRVPIIVKNTTDVTKSPLFNKHAKDECKVCDVAIVSGGVLTKSKPTTTEEVAADREQVYNVDVYGGGELYIPSGTTYTVNTLTVRAKGDEVGIVDVQGTLNRNNTTLIHSKRFHNAGSDWRWYYFSLPYDCNVSEVTFSNGDPAIHGADFEIDWFDGEQRASSQAGGNWKSIASHPDYPNVIKAGYGYTIAVEEKSGHTNVSLVFPMANFSEPTQVNVPVGNWGAGDDDVTVNHKGWNVVGNPFLTKYKAQEDVDVNGELREGMLVLTNGEWTQEDNDINYATVPLNGGISGYEQEALTNHLFNPFQSFIIQVGGDAERNDLAVQLKNTYKNKRASVVQRRESEYEAGALEPVKLRVNLTNANGELDKTTLIISDKYTPEYDMTYDLTKWRGTSYRYYTQPVLASVYGGQELAFNALPDSVVANSVPLTCYSRNAGKMAFELSGDYSWNAFEEVILHDKVLGVNHNLLTNGKYEFDAAAGETSERFAISAIVNRYNEPTIATSTDLVDMQNVRLTVCERSILLNGLETGTTVYVFDMLGRLVGHQTCNQPFAKFNVPATGVYNIRLEGQKAGVTLRAIVK